MDHGHEGAGQRKSCWGLGMLGGEGVLMTLCPSCHNLSENVIEILVGLEKRCAMREHSVSAF